MQLRIVLFLVGKVLYRAVHTFLQLFLVQAAVCKLPGGFRCSNMTSTEILYWLGSGLVLYGQ